MTARRPAKEISSRTIRIYLYVLVAATIIITTTIAVTLFYERAKLDEMERQALDYHLNTRLLISRIRFELNKFAQATLSGLAETGGQNVSEATRRDWARSAYVINRQLQAVLDIQRQFSRPEFDASVQRVASAIEELDSLISPSANAASSIESVSPKLHFVQVRCDQLDRLHLTAFLDAESALSSRDKQGRFATLLLILIALGCMPIGLLLVLASRSIKRRSEAEETLARRTLEAELLFEATAIVDRSNSFEEALQLCLDIVCEMIDWPVGHAYLPSPDGTKRLDPSGIWHLADQQRFSKLREVTERTSFNMGEGLPGRIWKSGEPEWIANMQTDSSFLRSTFCDNLGVKGGFGFPVKVKGKTSAILEFFTARRMERSDTLLLLVRSVGEQVGRLIERKKAEEELRNSESRFRTIFEQAAVGVALIETKVGRFVRINEKYEELIGYSNEEMTRLTFADITHPDDLDEDIANMKRLHAGEISDFRMEKRLIRKDGTAIWVKLTVSPTWQPDEEPSFHIAIVEDVSRTKLAEESLRTSEERYRSAVAALSEGIAVYDREMNLLTHNTSAERILGLTTSQMTASSLVEIASKTVRVDGSTFSSDEHPALDTLRTAKPHTNQIMGIHRPDGELTWVSLNTSPLFHEEQLQPYAVLTSFEDITERRRAQQQLLFTRFAIENVDEAMFVLNVKGKFVDVNETACKRLNYSRGELLNMTVADINPHYPIEQWPGHWNEIKRKGKLSFESEHMTKDGRVFPVEISKSFLEFEGIEYAFAFVRDISERLRSQQQLAESEAKYRTLVEHAPEAILVLDFDANRFVDFNENALRMFRVGAEQMRECSVADFCPPNQPDGRESAKFAIENIERALAGEVQVFEWTHRNSEGQEFQSEVRLVRLPATDKKLVRASVTDIRARKLAEQRLSESEAKFRALCERSSAIVAIVQAGRFRYANPATVAITGYSAEELANLDFVDIVHPQFRDLVTERHFSCQRGEFVTSRYEFKIVTNSGQERWIDLAAEAIEFEGQPAVLATCIDVTERKIAEEKLRERETQLAHLSRVNAMGEMASALAHELTQPLGAAANYAGGCIDMLEARQYSPDILTSTLEKLNEQVLRSGRIIGQLKSFVSQSRPKKSRLSVSDLAREVEQLLGGLLSQHRMKLRFDIGCDTQEILADRIQIEQVMVNLIRNAIDAMKGVPDGSREIVILATGDQGTAIISVADRGDGIDESKLRRVFEPYFTTKPDGMGMGLSICRTIINNHGGKLWATRNQEGGTSFHFTLPSAPADARHNDDKTQ